MLYCETLFFCFFLVLQRLDSSPFQSPSTKKALDKSVAEATEQRKEEHEDFNDLIASDSAAKELLAFARNRLNKRLGSTHLIFDICGLAQASFATAWDPRVLQRAHGKSWRNAFSSIVVGGCHFSRVHNERSASYP